MTRTSLPTLIASFLASLLCGAALADMPAPTASAANVPVTNATATAASAPQIEQGKFVRAKFADPRMWSMIFPVPGGAVAGAVGGAVVGSLSGPSDNTPIKNAVICTYKGPSGDIWDEPPAKPPCHSRSSRVVPPPPAPAPDSAPPASPAT